MTRKERRKYNQLSTAEVRAVTSGLFRQMLSETRRKAQEEKADPLKNKKRLEHGV
jgi:hypothetical protein